MGRAKEKEKSTQLIVQPGDGIKPLLNGILSAQSSIDILIFRFDRKEIEQALIEAVHRGVVVRALIAWTNRGGERFLRELEARLLAAGVLVARTANDLVRYHAKMMVVTGAPYLSSRLISPASISSAAAASALLHTTRPWFAKPPVCSRPTRRGSLILPAAIVFW